MMGHRPMTLQGPLAYPFHLHPRYSPSRAAGPARSRHFPFFFPIPHILPRGSAFYLSPAAAAALGFGVNGGEVSLTRGLLFSPEMDRARREREDRRLLDLAVECGFDRSVAASCLARLLDLYGTCGLTPPPPVPLLSPAAPDGPAHQFSEYTLSHGESAPPEIHTFLWTISPTAGDNSMETLCDVLNLVLLNFFFYFYLCWQACKVEISFHRHKKENRTILL